MQGGRSPAERFVRQLADHRIAGDPLTAATVTPVVGIDNSASQHGAVGVEALAGDDQSELVESAESGQISAAKAAAGSVDHVEVFRVSV